MLLDASALICAILDEPERDALYAGMDSVPDVYKASPAVV